MNAKILVKGRIIVGTVYRWLRWSKPILFRWIIWIAEGAHVCGEFRTLGSIRLRIRGLFETYRSWGKTISYIAMNIVIGLMIEGSWSRFFEFQEVGF